MKRNFIFIFIFTQFYSSFLAEEIGRLNTTKISPGLIINSFRMYYSNKLSYTTGGITFTYPEGVFSSAPLVIISTTLQNLEYSTNQIVNPQVTTNNDTSTIIRVNVSNGGTIQEAADNDVTVNLLAIGPPIE